MRRLAFDLETDGLLDELTKLHSLVIKDLDTGELVRSCSPETADFDLGLEDLAGAALLAGHNIVKFDLPALVKVFGWRPSPETVIRDTLIMARVVWPDIKATDLDPKTKRKPPGNLVGRYSLEAFGHRLGEYKGDYKGGWDKWSPEMQSYAEQDVEVTVRLWEKLNESMAQQAAKTGGKAWSGNAIDLEHRVQEIIARQEAHGFLFDKEAAMRLCQELAGRRAELEQSLRTLFPPWFRKGKPGVHARSCRLFHADENGADSRRVKPKGEPAYFQTGYYEEVQKGAEFTRVELRDFNPTSRFDVADRLIKVRGWKPAEFTADGHPKIDDTVLAGLPWAEAKALAELFMVDKRLGAVAEGKEAWLKAVKADGRIHGQVITNGAVTGRMTHMRPNIAQVPSARSKFGPECRALFTVPPGKKLVGCDADALELRCLAGYMARYDDGAYIDTVLRGDKAAGTDMHSVNARAIGLDPAKKYPVDGKSISGREIAKTWFYAFIYGAGDHKLGTILGAAKTKAKAAGAKSRAAFMANLPALGKLVDGVKARVQKVGGLVAIDGRFLRVRSPHAALNTLLQSAGAIFMKAALVMLDDTLIHHRGLYEFVANVHDEVQAEVDEGFAEAFGAAAANAIAQAGASYSFGCPLAGNYEIGQTWRDTH